jgi:DNA-binding GntR family transcriptional regulator
VDVFQIYEDLKNKIIWNEYKPETTFNLVKLAESFDVSRYPITMALHRLEGEDLVVRNGSHFMVSPISLDRIKENVEIRLILEIQANVWAMMRMQKNELSALETVAEKMSQQNAPVSTVPSLKLDLEFHRIIFKASRNNQVAQILDRLIILFIRYWLSVPFINEEQRNLSNIFKMIDAIKAKKEDMLREASIEHIKDSFEGIMEIS